MRVILASLISCTLLLAFSAQADEPKPTAQEVEFFETKIRRCWRRAAMPAIRAKPKRPWRACSSIAARRAAGHVRSRDLAGKPQESLLIRAIRHDGRKMPPGNKLPDA